MNSPTNDSAPFESAKALLTEIIDYAGLFPPSQATMAEAVGNYVAYKQSEYAWMLGRFVVPAVRLDEFKENAQEFLTTENVWHLSVLAGEDVYESIQLIENFNRQNGDRALCDALEVRAKTSSKIENTVNILPENLTAYFELPLDERLGDLVATLAILGQRAKIRTGGVTSDAFPKTREIIRFIRTCLAANVPFKATAGLHHPVRCFKPLTYEPDAPEGTMHGFLNLFLAAGFIRQGYKTNLVESLMEDEFGESFSFSDGGLTWHINYALTTRQLQILRERSAISFGSCSFDEPIADLREMGIL